MKAFMYILVSILLASCATSKKPDTSRYVVYVTNSGEVVCALSNPYSEEYIQKHFYKVYSKKRDSERLCMESKDYLQAQKMVLDLKYKHQIGLYALVREDGKMPRCMKMSNFVNRKILELYITKSDCEKSRKYQLHKENNQDLIDPYDEDDDGSEVQYEQELDRYADIRAYLIENPEYAHLKMFAQQRKIAVGMPEKLLELSWGKPNKVKRTVKKGLTYTQYYYGKTVVVLENGLVTSWHK